MKSLNNKQSKQAYNYLLKSPGINEQLPNSYLYSTNSSSLSSPLSFINDFLDYSNIENTKSTDSTGTLKQIQTSFDKDIRTNFPQFFKYENKIKVPSKVEYALRRFVPKSLMKAIDPNINVSVEKCLLFTSNFSSTYFDLLNDSKSEGWKELKAEYLQDYFSNSSMDYKNIFNALNYTLDTGSIIERDKFYIPGEKCYNYRLGEAYIQKGLKNYELKTEVAINLLNKRNAGFYKKALLNPICQNLIQFYKNCTFPTIDKAKEIGNQLVKEGHITKKGKKFISLNNRPKSYFKKIYSTKDFKKLSFLEDDIKRYQLLTENGIRIPIVGNEAFGGRVIDSITLMPSWIRDMIKYDGELLMECDYKCLHPNIASSKYGSKLEYITHEKLAAQLGLSPLIVKKQHLAYFNEEVSEMHHYIVDAYYKKFDPVMRENIIAEKDLSPFKHNVTSRTLFAKEVEIMTDVIIQLNGEGIYVGYVYDALLCHPKHADRLKQVMDNTCLKYGVKTTAKLPEVLKKPVRTLGDKKRAA